MPLQQQQQAASSPKEQINYWMHGCWCMINMPTMATALCTLISSRGGPQLLQAC